VKGTAGEARRRVVMKKKFGGLKAKKEAKSKRAKVEKSNWTILEIIGKLRKSEKRAFGDRHGRADFYSYLDQIYNILDWSNAQESEWWGQKVAALFDIDVRKNKSPIHITVDASSRERDRQKKSRWSVAIEYAVAKSVPKSKFIKFLENNGGVAGCASKMAALKKNRL
jgi:hypothetical protein